MEVKELHSVAKEKQKENKKFFERLKKHAPANLDKTVQQLNDEVFREIDCLNCANCCKTISTVFTSKDIERIAKTLRIRPAQLVEKYLNIDEDGDYVSRSTPCPFLGSDNYCSIYDDRPSACRQYPHTGRTQFAKVLKVTEKNISVCPAVYEIVEKLKAIY